MIRLPSVMNRFTIMPHSSESYLHQKTYANKCCFSTTSSIHDRYLARYMAIGIHAFMYSNRIHIHPSISIHLYVFVVLCYRNIFSYSFNWLLPTLQMTFSRCLALFHSFYSFSSASSKSNDGMAWIKDLAIYLFTMNKEAPVTFLCGLSVLNKKKN